jgi:DNA (cytosine-5)-methyltransferase 1
VTERAAPKPTVRGMRRLSADFVEWMMGLPDGWVTATEGLSRAAQLRLLGNSVVPHQAARVLDILLADGARPTIHRRIAAPEREVSGDYPIPAPGQHARSRP